MRRVPAMPQLGVIEGFDIKTLYDRNGELFRPGSLVAGTCTLARMFERGTREALRRGLVRYIKTATRVSVEEDFQNLYAHLNEELDKLYVGRGMAKGAGLALMLSAFDIQAGIVFSAASEHQGNLQRQAEQLGIYRADLVNDWVLLSYLDAFHVPGFAAHRFVDYLVAQNWDLAPPPSLSVDGCAEDLVYKTGWTGRNWTFDGFEYERAVHWGICRSSRKLWAYQYEKGWYELSTAEQERLCGYYEDELPFSEVCSRPSQY